MPRRCAIGCLSSQRALHAFPNPKKFPEQFKAWVRIVTGKDECDFDYRKKRVCDRHFTDKDRNRNNRLNALAVPSLYLLENVESAENKKTESSASISTITEQLQDDADRLLDEPDQLPDDPELWFVLDEIPRLSPDPILDESYNELLNEPYKMNSRKKDITSEMMSRKDRDYQQIIRNLRKQIYVLKKSGKYVKSQLENAQIFLNNPEFQKIMLDIKPALNIFLQ